MLARAARSFLMNLFYACGNLCNKVHKRSLPNDQN
jgi:hypothetical protein